MNAPAPAYGLWLLVIINSLIFIIFAFSFTKPRTSRDWRSFGAFSAFIVALFTEMYGFPLTIYLLSGWLQSLYPNRDLFSHEAGHVWWTLLGLKGDPHLYPNHILSNLVIAGGLILLIASWRVLYKSQRKPHTSSHGTLCVGAPSPVRCFCADHGWFLANVAHDSDAANVSHFSHDVYPLNASGGARSSC